MKGLIILEGADGTGKTTLARYLQKTYGAKYLHMTYRFKSEMFTYHAAMLKHAVACSEHGLVILDRCWISDTIYGAEYRVGSEWPLMGRFLDRVAQKHAAITVLCIADDIDAYSARFAKLKGEREEMYDDTTNVAGRYKDLYHGYRTYTNLEQKDDYVKQLIKQGGMKKRADVALYRIENEGQDLPLFSQQLLRQLSERRFTQSVVALKADNQNFLGHAGGAKYVMIGDTPSETKYRGVNWPFFFYGHSSLYLTQAMADMNLKETDFCWVNINDEQGVRNASELVDGYHLTPIILGENARDTYEKTGLTENYRFMPHPSYLKRFKSLYITMTHLYDCITGGIYHV